MFRARWFHVVWLAPLVTACVVDAFDQLFGRNNECATAALVALFFAVAVVCSAVVAGVAARFAHAKLLPGAAAVVATLVLAVLASAVALRVSPSPLTPQDQLQLKQAGCQ
jgi:tetrahydromethanopterin S-methyltransferase subunit D